VADWKLAYHANCWGPLGGHPVGVTSVKDLTYMTFGDMSRAFRDIGAAGYKAVELFDGNLSSYDGRLPELRAQLDGAGLQLLAVYSGGNFIFPDIISEELWRIERMAGLAAEAGAMHLVVGGGAKRSNGLQPGDYERLGDALDRVVAIAEGHGLRAHYHPHLTTMAETPEQIAEIFAHTRIGFCPDTAHLAAAGGDPAQLITQHAERVSYVHLKGWQREPFAFTPLGRGDLDMAPVLQALRERGFSEWICVELDAWDDPAAGARESFEYLQRDA
jgi:inosose dehydratase